MGKAKRAHHLFAERTLKIVQISSPILCEQALFDMAMKAAVRPIGYSCDAPMLHWIAMDIVDMTFKVGVVSNRVLPVSTLPDAFLSLGDLAH